jgi:hypothetical protein
MQDSDKMLPEYDEMIPEYERLLEQMGRLQARCEMLENHCKEWQELSLPDKPDQNFDFVNSVYRLQHIGSIVLGSIALEDN